MGRNFRRITAWQKADELAVEVYRVTGRVFPVSEKFGLVAQLRSAAVSVAANIAEGSARGTDAEFRRFLWIAQGSLIEVEYYLHLSRRLGYLGEKDYGSIEETRSLAGKTLSGLLGAVSRGHSRYPLPGSV